MNNLHFAGIDPLLLLNKKFNANLQEIQGLHPVLKLAGLTEEAATFLNYTFKMPFTHPKPPRIVLIGCGGTGSHLLPNILQFVHSKRLKDGGDLPEIILVDGDTVEEKNLVRQRFTSGDLGMNKAAALAQRYTGVFGIRIKTYEDFLVSSEDLELIAPRDGTNIIIGAVDNHRARMIIWQYYLEGEGSFHPTFWIDSGNEGWHGQAILSARFYPRTSPVGSTHWSEAGIGTPIKPVNLPCFFDEYPDEFLKVGSTPVTPQNECARMVEVDPQTIQANMMSAFCATTLFIQAFTGQIRTTALYFDALSGNTKAAFLSRLDLASYPIKMEASRTRIMNFLKGLDVQASLEGESKFDEDFSFLVKSIESLRTGSYV